MSNTAHKKTLFLFKQKKGALLMRNGMNLAAEKCRMFKSEKDETVRATQEFLDASNFWVSIYDWYTEQRTSMEVTTVLNHALIPLIKNIAFFYLAKDLSPSTVRTLRQHIMHAQNLLAQFVDDEFYRGMTLWVYLEPLDTWLNTIYLKTFPNEKK